MRTVSFLQAASLALLSDAINSLNPDTQKLLSPVAPFDGVNYYVMIETITPEEPQP